jgi:hypothetical protein
MVIETVVRWALRRRACQYREEWEGAGDVRAPANGFRRRRLGLAPVRPQEDGADSETVGVQLMIDARTDTYEQAVAAPGPCTDPVRRPDVAAPVHRVGYLVTAPRVGSSSPTLSSGRDLFVDSGLEERLAGANPKSLKGWIYPRPGWGAVRCMMSSSFRGVRPGGF